MIKDEDLNNQFLRMSLYFSPSSNPNFSITRVLLTKIRIFLEWAIRRSREIGIRRKALSGLRKRKNSMSSKFALVLANGPSLNTISLEEVAKAQLELTEVFAVNFFPIVEKTQVMIPNYVVLSDPGTKPNSLDPRSIELWNWFELNQKVQIICPSSWYRSLRDNRFDLNRFVFFDDTALISWSRNVSPVRARGYLSLTAYKALSVACFFGYSEIEIIGFDNSQIKGLIVDEKNRLFQGPSHFVEYENISDITDLYYRGVGDYFHDFSCAFLDLRKFSHFENIWNLDRHSFVDAFPKKTSSKFLNRA
jgi:hypothetical protein